MSEYEVELFTKEGFKRKKCPTCGKYFWNLSERQTCGEPPCEEYSFISNPPTKKSLTTSQVREHFLSFFEKKNHTRIPRYPIIARWRDDIFFTIASISCFQPWVLNRTIDPPANPLVMSQTCVRFNDIDNVGKTGRHLTEFEMMAHHAFNTEEKTIYFKDRTVELCNDLLTGLGISPEDITYIEAEWAGGGNSGPCFEVIVRGVELATLVFMMYENTASGRKKMDMQVVDTGYGLERFAWVSQGTANTYEAIFGDVLCRLKNEIDLSPDEKILGEYSKLAGMMNVESNADLKVLRKRLAERIGSPLEKIVAEITPFENLYSLCDHTRSLAFMLNDGGIVPSNVKAGYFARLLARKSIRSISNLGLDFRLSDVIGMQVDYLKQDFPEFKETREDIIELARVEEEKYTKTQKRGKQIIKRLEEETRKNGSEKLSTSDLIDLYDSHGIVPELVSEFATIKVEIPDDFYIKVSEKHAGDETREKDNEKIKIPEVEPTIFGFYEDAYVHDFEAQIIKKFEDYIILDKTYFYPEGGGQETDYGTLGGLEVTEVQKQGGVVVHRIKGDHSPLREGSKVKCRLDWTRRLQLMQHHTATHIINGAARRVLGNHAWQSGAHKSEELGRIDLTHHSRISEDEKRRIEELANQVITEKRPIVISFMDRDDAENAYGFRIYQGGAVPGKSLRIISIDGWDTEACGGMHFKNAAEVGSIKITSTRRIQDGVVRIEFKAGGALEKHIESIKALNKEINTNLSEAELENIADIFSVQKEQLPGTIKRFGKEWSAQAKQIRILNGEKNIEEPKPTLLSVDDFRRLFEEWKNQKKDIDKLQRSVQEDLVRKIKQKICDTNPKVVKEITSGLDVKNLMSAAKRCKQEGLLLIIINKIDKKVNIIVNSESAYPAVDICKRLCSHAGGGCRGDAKTALGGGSSDDIEEILEEFEP